MYMGSLLWVSDMHYEGLQVRVTNTTNVILSYFGCSSKDEDYIVVCNMLKSHFVSFGSALLAGFSRDKSGETGATPCWLHRGIQTVHSQRLSSSCISLQVAS